MRPRPDRTALRRVAVVQTAFVGDVLLTLPLLSALRTELPQASITLVTTPAGADAVGGASVVDHIVAFDKRGAHRGSAGLRAVAQAVGPVDALLVPHKSLRTARLVRYLEAPYIVTYKDAWSRWVADVAVPYPRPLHDADRHLRLLRVLLPEATWTKERCLPLTLCSDDDRTTARALVGEGAPYVVLAPGTAWPTKQWPLRSMQELAASLVHDGLRCVIVGDDRVRGTINGVGVIDLCGKTSLRQAAAVIGNAAAVVANDSAPLHLASLQDVPVVGIFGPTVTNLGFGPFGQHAAVAQRTDLACRPCSPHGTASCPLGTHACMRGLVPGAVRATLDTVLLHR